jgi:hypothetical protein
MMKKELLEKFKTLLQAEDITSIKAEVKDLLTNYNGLTSEEKKAQQEAWNKEEAAVELAKEAEASDAPAEVEVPAETETTERIEAEEENTKPKPPAEAEVSEEKKEFIFNRNPLDAAFDELYSEFKTRTKEHREKQAEEERANAEKKRALLEEFKSVVSTEENIGKAFAEFNRIRDEWNEVGNTSSNDHRALMDEFIKVKDDFFYNINIYKQLQEHDLKKNEVAKRDLIEKIKSVKGIESIREADDQVRHLQSQWMNLGPVSKDIYQELADEFFGISREIIGRIREHYEGLKAKQDENLVAKKELITKVNQINDLEIVNHGTWTKKTNEILEIQAAWKTTGFVRKEENESSWTEFRSACDAFFNRKEAYYTQRKSAQSENRDLKEKLIEEAEAIADSEAWKETSQQLIALQKKWKEIGSAPQKDEQRLWQKFRNACDKFFETKKKHFEGFEIRQAENLTAKRTLLEEIKAYKLAGNKNEDLSALREFNNRFQAIGYVPKKDIKEIMDGYSAIMDEKYAQLNLDREEKMMLSYKQRIQSIKSTDNSDGQLRKEKNLLRDKIDRLQDRVRQFENNIELFTGDGAASMRKDYEKKINSAKREIEEIKRKMQLI